MYGLSAVLLLAIILIVTEKYRDHSYLPSAHSTALCPTSFRLITYNIQALPWLMKSLSPLKEISNDADVIVLQECFNQFKRSEVHHYFTDYYICRGKMQRVRLLNCGLTVLSKYPILDSTFIAFKDINLYSFDSFAEKGFLSVLVKIGNRDVHIITTHLQSSTYEEYDPVCFLQYQQILEYIRTLMNPFILAGDFNVDIEECKKRFPFYDFHTPSSPTIYMNFKKGYTQSTPEEGYYGRKLDYLITNKLQCSVPRVISSTFSDHNPVEATISFL
jgi:endonuclease/exonuclease/phosphatase family metal-dependent hydrolase